MVLKKIRNYHSLRLALFFLFFLSMGQFSQLMGQNRPFLGHWKLIQNTFKENFRTIMVYNSQIIWASGTHGTVIHSLDGGKTWSVQKVPGAENLDFRSLYVLDENTIILVSAGESEKGQTCIYRSQNQGKDWELVYKPIQAGIFLDGIKFWDKEKGLILGDPIQGRFFILYTSDSGKHWDTLPGGQMPIAGSDEGAFAASNTSLFLLDKGLAWFGTGGNTGGRIFKSLNYGKDWTAYPTPIQKGKTSGIFSVYFLNHQMGWASGGNYKNLQDTLNNNLETHDGGITWEHPSESIPSGYIESFLYLSPKNLLAIGPNGTSLYNKDLGKWKAVDSLAFHALSKYKNSIWAIGPNGILGKWESDKGN